MLTVVGTAVSGDRGAGALLIALMVIGGASCAKRAEPQPVASSAPEPPRPGRAAPAPALVPQVAADTLARVRAIAGEITGAPVSAILDDVPLGKNPRPADDLDIVEIVLALEDAFHIEIPDQDLDEAAGGRADLAHYISVRRLAEIVERHRKTVSVDANKRRGKKAP